MYIIYEISTGDCVSDRGYIDSDLDNMAEGIQEADEEMPMPDQEYVIALVIEEE